MIGKYSYLKDFKVNKIEDDRQTENLFFPVLESEILKAEKSLKCIFPKELKEFYKEIGYGFLTHPYNYKPDYFFYNTNRINHPEMIVEILLKGQQSGLISDDAYELLEPGDLPFFEISDSSSFLVMKLNSINPNAVWSDCGVKIEDSFEKFIWRLYYEDPGYYGDIIEKHYQ